MKKVIMKFIQEKIKHVLLLIGTRQNSDLIQLYY